MSKPLTRDDPRLSDVCIWPCRPEYAGMRVFAYNVPLLGTVWTLATVENARALIERLDENDPLLGKSLRTMVALRGALEARHPIVRWDVSETSTEGSVTLESWIEEERKKPA